MGRWTRRKGRWTAVPFEDPEEWMTSFDADHLAYFGLNDVPSTLTDCIQDTKWRDALELWSEKNYTAENVKFLLAFQEAFGTLEPDSIDMTKMLPLFDEYVPESAPHQINISSEVRKWPSRRSPTTAASRSTASTPRRAPTRAGAATSRRRRTSWTTR
jgi:hypothetical protein